MVWPTTKLATKARFNRTYILILSSYQKRKQADYHSTLPSMTGTLRKIHFYIECEQAVEECRLAMIVPRCEPAVGDVFAAVLQQSEPQQWPQNSRLHGISRPVPSPRQCGRFRDGAQPRQLLTGLPVACGNR